MVEAPDEFAHYWVIKFLRETMTLPGANDVAAGGASAVYGSLPQLGYIPHVLISFAMPLEWLALSERLGSLVMGEFMLFSAYCIGMILFPKNRIAALALPAAIVVHPQIAFIQAYANNDSTSSAIASLLLWLSLETVSKGMHFGRTLCIGALTGWLAITKYSGLAVIPSVALALISSIFLNGTSLPFAFVSLFSAAGLAVALSSWWFLRNSTIFPGDFLGTQTMYKSWALTYHRELNYNLPVSHIIKDHRWWRSTLFSYWAMFGYMNKEIWKVWYWTYFGFMVTALLGSLQSLATWLKSRASIDKKALVAWCSLALCFVVNIALMIAASTKNLGGPQGRYLITSEIPIMALIIGGLYLFQQPVLNLFSRRLKLGEVLIVVFLAYNSCVTIGSWIYLFTIYHGFILNPLPQ